MLAHRLRIHGRVQGVGFRVFVFREASLLGVAGWVRNRGDGTVEALVWGDETSVDALLDRLHEGPRWGRVERIDVTVESGDGGPSTGFEIRRDR